MGNKTSIRIINSQVRLCRGGRWYRSFGWGGPRGPLAPLCDGLSECFQILANPKHQFDTSALYKDVALVAWDPAPYTVDLVKVWIMLCSTVASDTQACGFDFHLLF